MSDEHAIWLSEQRLDVLRWCRSLLPSSGEDATQDVMVEVLLHADRVPADPAQRGPWLYGVTRNVCGRHRRYAGTHPTAELDDNVPGTAAPMDAIDPDFDRVLIAAQRTMPANLRPVADEIIFRDTSIDAAAEALGISPGHTRVLLHRARRHLQLQLMAAETDWPSTDPWVDTSIWCWECGRARLIAGYVEGERLKLVCPQCERPGRLDAGRSDRTRKVLAGARTVRPALTRISRWNHGFFSAAGLEGAAPCGRCGAETPIGVTEPESATDHPGFTLVCQRCAWRSDLDVVMFGLFHPAAMAFWKRHPRLAVRHVEESRFLGDPIWRITYGTDRTPSVQLSIRRSDFATLHIAFL